jgi:hypothetical protein
VAAGRRRVAEAGIDEIVIQSVIDPLIKMAELAKLTA